MHDSREADLPALYGHWVRHGRSSFETEPPGAGEMARRREALRAAGHPCLVIKEAGPVLGYAHAGPFRTRRAYRFTAEDSACIAPDAGERGLGRTLLGALPTRPGARHGPAARRCAQSFTKPQPPAVLT